MPKHNDVWLRNRNQTIKCRCGTSEHGLAKAVARARRGGRGRSVPPLAAPGAASRCCLRQGPNHRVARGRRALSRGAWWDAGGLWGGAVDRGLAAGAAAASGERREGAASSAAAAPPPPQVFGASPVQGTASALPPAPLAGRFVQPLCGDGRSAPGQDPGTPRSGRFAHTLICF